MKSSIAQVTATLSALVWSGLLLGQSPDSFNPDADDVVRCVAVQPDGRILAGGQFGSVGGVPRKSLARVNADGTLDAGFDAQTGNVGEVYSLAVQANGGILVGGNFTTIGGFNHARIARLDAGGTVDNTFNASASFYVNSLVPQPDGRILLAGAFTTVNGVTRNRIARLNADGSLDTGFNPNADGTINAMALQPDGKILVGGAFTTMGGVTRNRIARLNADGSLDTGFNPNAGGTVNAITLQPDAKILVGGAFTKVGAVTRNRIARLNADGSLDTGFNPGANGSVLAIALQADGGILIGGSFSIVGGGSCGNIARLSANGVMDKGFTPFFDVGVSSVQLQSDGEIVVGGSFIAVSGTARRHLARLPNDIPAPHTLSVANASRIDWMPGGGSPEVEQVTFDVWDGSAWTGLGAAVRVPGGWSLDGLALPAQGWVRARGREHDGISSCSVVQQVAAYGGVASPDIAVEGPDGGQILPGGSLVDFGSCAWPGSVAHRTLRITNVGDGTLSGLLASVDGANADEFTADLGGVTRLEPGASTVLTVSFTTRGGGMRAAGLSIASNDLDEAPFAVSLMGTGSHGDATFDPNLSSGVRSMAIQPDGRILLSGDLGTVGGVARSGIARLNPDGRLDYGFSPAVTESVYCLAVRADGVIVVGGTIQSVNGTAVTNAARLGKDGSLLGPVSFNSDVNCLAFQADGALLAGGAFTSAGGATRNRIARFRADGTLDATFNPNATGSVACLAVETNGRILMGGAFTKVAGVTRNRIARLNPDGSLDTGFDPNASAALTCLAAQPDGRILIGGAFTTVGAVARNYLARLNTDGTVDTGFNPAPNGSISSILVQTDGRIVVGGDFTLMGQVRRNRIARLNPDGTVDSGFDPNAGASVSCLAMQADGSILAGGDFTMIGGAARNRVARLPNDIAATQILRAGPGGLVEWLRGGGSPEVQQVTFAAWDGGAWLDLGQAVRIEGGWARAGLTIPANSWVRARAHIQGGKGNASGGILETVAASGGAIPVMVVSGPEGEERVSGTGLVDFGIVDWPAAGENRTFRLSNAGGAVLAGLAVAAGGTNAGDFRIIPPSETSLEPGTSTTFSVVFAPDGAGTTGYRTARISVSSTDAAASPFAIEVAGTVFHRDIAFDPNAGAAVYSLALQPDERILVGGGFSNMGGGSFDRFARLNKDGTPDVRVGLSFGSVGSVNGVVVLPDGKILLGGYFTTVGGMARNNFARLNADGTVDPGFDPNVTGAVTCVALQPDGKIVIGGGPFTSVGGTTRNSIARLNGDGSLDSGFNPDANGVVNCVIVQADGKLLIGGGFTTIGGVTRNRIARLNADGTLDTAFDPNSTWSVYCLALQADGKILVGGEFNGIGGGSRSYLARLNADGTLDTAFDPNANAAVKGFGIQADGKILIGGAFTTVGGVTRYRIARLNTDGTLDPAFNPGASAEVLALALQTDGALLTGGSFTTMGGVARNRIARLPNDIAATQTLAVTGDGRIDWIRGGSCPEVEQVTFQMWNDSGWVELGPANRITGGWRLTGASIPASGWLRAQGRATAGRYNGSSGLVEQVASYGGGGHPDIWVRGPDGDSLDSLWNSVDLGTQDWPGAGPERVFTITNAGSAPLEGLAVTIGGPNASEFAAGAPGASRLEPGESTTLAVVFTPTGAGDRLAVLSLASNDADESPFVINLGGTCLYRDAGFNPGLTPTLGAGVNGLAMQPDNKILIGGDFSGSSGVAGANIARLGPDGTKDAGFNPSASQYVTNLVVQPDGRILVGGNFTVLGGAARNRLARLNADGTIDTGFNPNADGLVYGMATQPDGKILVSGFFSNVGGVARRHIARLNADGTLDTGFNPSPTPGSSVNCVALQPDGKILIGGDFTEVNGFSNRRIARLNGDGTVDTVFNAPVEGGSTIQVYCLAVQADGKILVGGSFTSVSGTARSNIARLNADGTLDTGFNPGADGAVRVFTLQADGKILLGGTFWVVAGEARRGIARLNSDGSLDRSLNPTANSSVNAIALQPDGRILVGGFFNRLGGLECSGLVRLPNNIPATQVLSVTGGSQIEWLRGGSAPEIERVSFEIWDGTAWISQGNASRIAGGWRLDAATVPAGAWVRARGFTSGGWNNGSSGLVEQIVSYGDAAVPLMVVESSTGEPMSNGVGTVDFGAVGIGKTRTRTFLIRNTGAAELKGLAITKHGDATGAFIPGPPDLATLPPGGSATFPVTFSPSALAPLYAVIRISSGDWVHPPFEMRVTGAGFLLPQLVVEQPSGFGRASGGVFDFGAVPKGTTSPKVFTVRNTGPGTLNLHSPTVGGTGADDFAPTAAGTLLTLRQGESTTFLVVFAPSAAGLRTADLSLRSNDPDCPDFVLGLTGRWNSPPVFSGYATTTPFHTTARIPLLSILAQASDPDGDAIGLTAAGPVSSNGGAVSVQAGNIVYTPPASFSGEDSFRVTIADVCGTEVVGSISVTVGPPPQLVAQPGGAMQIQFHGVPGRPYPIQRSTDLATWEVIATVTADQSGLVLFSDESPPLPSAYYRLDVE